MKRKTPDGSRFSSAFKVGAIALAFLVIGYQSALFMHQAAVESIVAKADAREVSRADVPARDSVLVATVERQVVQKYGRKEAESFRFDPNTIGLEDLQRLGFSPKQAQSIINYREKGGRFNRPSDFAKSFVVADSVYQRLEPFIDIPLIDLNAADSAAFDNLPGIGPYYAAKMVEYRQELGGYSFPEQLMEIRNFDEERFDALKDLICIGEHPGYRLWSLSEEELEKHPYIDKHAAHGIVLFRENSAIEAWTIDNLAEAGIIDEETARKVGRCLIEIPSVE